MAVVGIAGHFVELGFNTFLTREIAQQRSEARRFLLGSWLAKVLLAVAMAIPYYILLRVGFQDRDDALLAALVLAPLLVLIIALNASVSSVFIAYEHMNEILLFNVLAVTAQLAGLFGLTWAGYNVDTLIWWTVIVQIGRFLFSWYRMEWFLKNKDEGPIQIHGWGWLKFSMNLINRAWPIGLSTMAVTIHTRLDVILLSFIAGDRMVGLYSAAYRFIDLLRMPPGAFQGAYFPMISRAEADGLGTEVERNFKRARWWFIGYGLGCVLIIVILAPYLVRWLYTEQFTPSISILQSLVWIMIPLVINDLMRTYLYATGREHLVPKVSFIGIIINGGLLLWAIPAFGTLGAVMSVLISNVVLSGLFWNMATRKQLGQGKM
jgi:O-antigen/teichoic acid export membrane protein